MRQTFNEIHRPQLRPQARAADPTSHGRRADWTASWCRTRTNIRTNTCPPPTIGWPGPPDSPARPAAAVILKDKAAVFVDSRYALQVRDQVDSQACSRYAAIWSRAACRPIWNRPLSAGQDHRLRPAPAQPRGARPAAVGGQPGRRGAETGLRQSAGHRLGRRSPGPAAGAGIAASVAGLCGRKTRPPSGRGWARTWKAAAEAVRADLAGLDRLRLLNVRGGDDDPFAPTPPARPS